jgi:hypothetical protein
MLGNESVVGGSIEQPAAATSVKHANKAGLVTHRCIDVAFVSKQTE